MSVPKTTKQWILYDNKKGLDELKLEEAEIPTLGDGDVLVKIRGVSLNYRDLIIPKDQYPFPVKFPRVLGSDGAGDVVAVGKAVTRFKPGDKVVTLFNQKALGGPIDSATLGSSLGSLNEGVLRQYAAFYEDGLVLAPSNLNYIESASLTCAGLTAYNSLFGLKPLKPGDWVLTQGTGGVSLFALQFAKSAGARVVSTTGSDDKVALLKKLGADAIINYKTTPEWGAEARKLTGGAGFNQIIEVAGPASMKQSLDAIALDGLISIVGFLGGADDPKQPGFLHCLYTLCTARGVFVGSRPQMVDMISAIEANGDKLKPVIDKKVFKFEELREALEHLEAAKHIGTIGIEIN